MSNVLSKVKSILGFEDYEDYDDFEDEEYENEEMEEENSAEPVITNKKNNKVVNIHTSSAVKATNRKRSLSSFTF